MQLENISQLPDIANKSNFTIFELPESTDFSVLFPNSFHVKKLEDKNEITKELIDETIALTNNKQSSDFYIVVEGADHMNDNAANCILKNLEEPGHFIHYIFLVNQISKILPTIRSRAFCYYLPSSNHIKDAPELSPDEIALAKKYLAASPSELIAIADKIAKDKKNPRGQALNLIKNCIQLMYKSYFATGKSSFLGKLEQLLRTQEALKANGNIKLQLIANML